MKLNRWDTFVAGMLLVFLVDDLVAHKYLWAAADAACLAWSAAMLIAERIQNRRTSRAY
jgi:hypothetical protein